jgi:hypothetical protein
LPELIHAVAEILPQRRFLGQAANRCKLTMVWSARVKDRMSGSVPRSLGAQPNCSAAVAQAIRWILLLPAAVAAWYVALLLGIALHIGLDAICPPDQMVSGSCVAPWHWAASQVVVCIGAALAAVLIVVTCTFVAPSHKRIVAVITFTGGTLVAIVMVLDTDAYAAFASAIVAGLATLLLVLQRIPSFSLPDNSLERTRGG